MLKVSKRHTTACVAGRKSKGLEAATYDAYTRCTCQYWASGTLAGAFVRKTLKTSSLDEATRLARQWEGSLAVEPAPERGPQLAADAVAAYLSDAEARNLAPDTLTKLRTIFEKQLLGFCRDRGYRLLTQIADVSVIRDFRSTWKDAPLARSKKQDRVVGFFYFCTRSGWLPANPVTVRALGKIRVDEKPTDYFLPEEIESILVACGAYRGDRWDTTDAAGRRMRALTLLMRWTGLRIRDAVTLERARLTKTDRGGDSIFLYQAKTGEPVYCPIPPEAAEALRTVPAGRKPNEKYFFWSGNGNPKSVVADFQRSYRRLFALAGIAKRAHPHMFRDTFAVECLLAGVSLERVSTLLGHSSVKVTEKHYKPHVKALQWELEDEVAKSWDKSNLKVDPRARRSVTKR